jgi:hypothetical protein
MLPLLLLLVVVLLDMRRGGPRTATQHFIVTALTFGCACVLL